MQGPLLNSQGSLWHKVLESWLIADFPAKSVNAFGAGAEILFGYFGNVNSQK